ncbi:MAG: hypothetical protein MJ233_03425 [Mycoplasmoidaceae bacterium]|nr:hypothetical protein [Mycoplasmoidaceae bacterium]
MQRHYGRTSFVGLERTLMVTIEGTTFPYRVLVVGEQEDYMEYHDNKFTNPCALTFEFQNALSPSDGVEEKFYYSAQQKPQRSR